MENMYANSDIMNACFVFFYHLEPWKIMVIHIRYQPVGLGENPKTKVL